MKVLVCGGRDFCDLRTLARVLGALHLQHRFTCLIHGDARGADSLAGRWAEQNGVVVVAYPADWKKHGRSAGPIRNREMLAKEHPDLVVAFPGGKGTAHMIALSKSLGYTVHVV